MTPPECVQAHHLLLPSLVTSPSGSLTASPSLVALLFGVPALQQALMDILLDCMAAHLARNHKGEIGGPGRRRYTGWRSGAVLAGCGL